RPRRTAGPASWPRLRSRLGRGSPEGTRFRPDRHKLSQYFVFEVLHFFHHSQPLHVSVSPHTSDPNPPQSDAITVWLGARDRASAARASRAGGNSLLSMA